MFSRIRSGDNSSAKEKLECKCINVPIGEKTDEQIKLINVDCSSHPGLCIIDETGLCTKGENAPHCSLTPVQLVREASVSNRQDFQVKCVDACCGKYYGKKFHSYKIDLNNAEDTGLFADKQCQTCGPNCSAFTCTSRSRRFFISWDNKRTKIFITLIIAFCLWLCIYTAVSAST